MERQLVSGGSPGVTKLNNQLFLTTLLGILTTNCILNAQVYIFFVRTQYQAEFVTYCIFVFDDSSIKMYLMSSLF